MIFEIIFVRHGISCGNAWAQTAYGMQTLYPDPELSKSGVDRSKVLSASLVENLRVLWPSEPFTVCASQMIRAQETAFYMLSSVLGLPIHVIPHVGETGLTLDNFALKHVDQVHIMMKRNPAVVDMLIKGHDGRLPQTLWNKSNYDLFIQWALKHPDFFAIGSDGRYRAVIFTHSNFLKATFKMDKKLDNNTAIFTVIDTSKKSELQFEYLTNHGLSTEVINDCPDGCLKSPCDFSQQKIPRHRYNSSVAYSNSPQRNNR